MNNCNKRHHFQLLGRRVHPNPSGPLSSIILCLIVAALPPQPLSASEGLAQKRPSLHDQLSNWSPPPNLNALFAQYETDSKFPKELTALMSKAVTSSAPFSVAIEQKLKEGTGYVRGELLNSKTQSHLESWVKFQVLTLAFLRLDSPSCEKYQNQASTWMYWLAELAYNEASSEAMSLVSKWRNLFLNELQIGLVPSSWQTCDIENTLNWYRSLRLPWPVDRILITESRGIQLLAKERTWLNKAASSLQKNPHQSLDSWLKAEKVYVSNGLAQVTPHWNASHVSQMQNELAKHQKIHLLLATELFKSRHAKAPQSQADLVTSQIIRNILIDPTTGKEQALPKIQ